MNPRYVIGRKENGIVAQFLHHVKMGKVTVTVMMNVNQAYYVEQLIYIALLNFHLLLTAAMILTKVCH